MLRRAGGKGLAVVPLKPDPRLTAWLLSPQHRAQPGRATLCCVPRVLSSPLPTWPSLARGFWAMLSQPHQGRMCGWAITPEPAACTGPPAGLSRGTVAGEMVTRTPRPLCSPAPGSPARAGQPGDPGANLRHGYGTVTPCPHPGAPLARLSGADGPGPGPPRPWSQCPPHTSGPGRGRGARRLTTTKDTQG